MLMMFYALREDLLPASRAIAVRISVIPKIQLLHVCLAGKYQAVRKEKRSLRCVVSFFPLLFFLLCPQHWSEFEQTIHFIHFKCQGVFVSDMWSQFAETPCKLSPLSCCIIWSAIFPHVTLLYDQDRHWVYARRHLLNYSKAPLSLHVPFVVVLGGIRGQLTFTLLAWEWMQVGWWWWRGGCRRFGGKRVPDEEGDGGKRWVEKCCACVCACWPAYPSPFVSLCGAVMSAGGGHVKRRTLASRMAPLPGFSRSPSSLSFTLSSWPAAKNTYFLC